MSDTRVQARRYTSDGPISLWAGWRAVLRFAATIKQQLHCYGVIIVRNYAAVVTALAWYT